MLRITVARESATDTEVIAEIVVGKLAGSDQSAGYAAYISEAPSRYSNGVEAAVVVKRHARFQPALALVASVLSQWQEGRTAAVGEGLRSLLQNSFRRRPPTLDWEDPTGQPLQIGMADALDGDGTDAVDLSDLGQARELAARLEAMAAAGRVPDGRSLRAARALLESDGDPALAALANAVEAVALRG